MSQNNKLLHWAQFVTALALLVVVGLQVSNVIDYGETSIFFYALLFINIVLASTKLVTLKQNNKNLSPVILQRLIWLSIGLTAVVLGLLFVKR